MTRFAILGSLVVTRGGAEMKMRDGVRWRILAALLVNAPDPVSEAAFTRLLWGGEPDGNWREQRLQPAISRLRKQLSEPGGPERIVRDGRGYRLEVGREELDAFVFEDLHQRADEALRRKDPRTALDLSNRALALWRGPALSDFAEEAFALDRTSRLDHARVLATQTRIEALLELEGHEVEAAVEADALLKVDPDNETLLGLLMLAYYRTGRSGAAEAAHRDHVARLRADGRRPGRQLSDLAAAIGRSDRSLDPRPAVAPPAAATRTFVIVAFDPARTVDPSSEDDAYDEERSAVKKAVLAQGGRVFGEDQPGAHAVFDRPVDALLAARDAALGLLTARVGGSALRARLAVHTGDARETVKGSFKGAAVRQLRQMRDACHPGQVVVSAATRELAMGGPMEDVQLGDIGGYQFDGELHPERVYQMVHPDLGAEFPSLLGARRPAGHLPRYTTGFVGREQEVEGVRRRLGRPGLVTISGEGGVGKSRLAVEVASRLTPADLIDGVCYCDVSLIDDANALVERLCLARGLTSMLMEQRTALVQSFDGAQILVVLDGCERLRSEAGELVNEILAAGAEVRLLVTSRGRLGVAPEHVVTLDPLSVEERPGPAAEPAHAVVLLHERALSAGARLAAADPDLHELARKLEGLPLTLELVAPLLAQFSPATVIERLDRVLATASAPDAPRHHSSLRATFDWSFDLLSPPARNLFGALSLFSDPWNLETAEAVAPAVGVEAEAVMGLTAELIDQSLVRVEMPADGTARYTMLDLIRGFGQAHLHGAKRFDDVADLHARHFLELAERVAPHRRGAEEAAWVRDLHAQFADLKSAYRRFVDTERFTEALRLTVALTHDLLMRERLEIGRWAADLADQPSLADDPLRVEALGLAANAAMLESRLDDAVALARKAVAGEAAIGARPSWTAHNVMALMTGTGVIRDNPWKWTRHLDVMTEHSERHGDPFPAALALWDRFVMAQFTGGWEYADEPSRQLLEMAGRFDNPTLRSMGMLTRGCYLMATGDADAAHGHFERAVAASTVAQNTLVLGQTRRELADLGNLGELIQGFGESGNVSEQLQTAMRIVPKLIVSGERVPAGVALELIAPTLMGQTRRFALQRDELDKVLTPAERSEVNRTSAGMSRHHLPAYLVKVVRRKG